MDGARVAGVEEDEEGLAEFDCDLVEDEATGGDGGSGGLKGNIRGTFGVCEARRRIPTLILCRARSIRLLGIYDFPRI